MVSYWRSEKKEKIFHCTSFTLPLHLSSSSSSYDELHSTLSSDFQILILYTFYFDEFIWRWEFPRTLKTFYYTHRECLEDSRKLWKYEKYQFIICKKMLEDNKMRFLSFSLSFCCVFLWLLSLFHEREHFTALLAAST